MQYQEVKHYGQNADNPTRAAHEYVPVEGEWAFDWNAIQSKRYLEDVRTEITRQLATILAKTGTVPLNELLTFANRGGQQAIRELDRRQVDPMYGPAEKGTWKIHILSHSDGSAPKPGDEFRWVYETKTTYIDTEGKRQPMNTRELERMMKLSRRPGDQFDWRVWKVFTLDADCCFTCGYNDAMTVLVNMTEHSIYPPDTKGQDVPYTVYHLAEEVPLDWHSTRAITNAETKRSK